MPNVPEILRSAAATFEGRNAVYGEAYKRTGGILMALFPDGVPMSFTPEQAARMSTLLMCVMKLQRYANNFEKGGHKDSAHDLIVYAAILEEQTNE